jgi:hypothetical protein
MTIEEYFFRTMEGSLKTSLIGIVVLLATASAARGAAVTLTLRQSFACASNEWALYADASADTAGIASYNIDLTGTFGTFLNRGNGLTVQDVDGTADTRSLGFTTGRTQDVSNGRLSGSQDLASPSLIPIYGIGQENDDLDNHVPPEFETRVSAVGAGKDPYSASFLLGWGTFTTTEPGFDVASGNNVVRTFDNRSGLDNSVADLQFRVLHGDRFCTPFVWQDKYGLGQNRAVGGEIMVSGGNSAYLSEVDQMTANAPSGYSPIEKIGAESGNVYVMARLLGSEADINGLLGALGQDVGPEDSQYAPLHAAYDEQFGAAGFNALFKFPNAAGAKVFNWYFNSFSNVTVDQLAAVPEPSAACLLLGGTLVLARRRRHARV